MAWSDAARKAAAEVRRLRKSTGPKTAQEKFAMKWAKIHAAEARRMANIEAGIFPKKRPRQKGFATSYGRAGIKVGGGGSY